MCHCVYSNNIIVHVTVCVSVLVGSCLATEVLIGSLPAMGRG